MTRSKSKDPVFERSILKKVSAILSKKEKDSPIKTKARSSTILIEFVGLTFAVYNGKTYIEFKITENMVGHKLGEFSKTRTFNGHKGSKV